MIIFCELLLLRAIDVCSCSHRMTICCTKNRTFARGDLDNMLKRLTLCVGTFAARKVGCQVFVQ